MFPSHITRADLLDLLYPWGRLRTSLAYQGAGNSTDWNEFAHTRKDEPETAETAPSRRSDLYAAVTSPLGSY